MLALVNTPNGRRPVELRQIRRRRVVGDGVARSGREWRGGGVRQFLGEMTSISFADFRGGQNARLQSFFSFTSGPEEQFAPDLALLVSLVAGRSLTPQTGPERNWRDIARVADELRNRRIGGKAVFRVEP